MKGGELGLGPVPAVSERGVCMNAIGPRFEVLEGLPPYGPRAEPFPSIGRATYSEGFVVRFFPTNGDPWVGNFAAGLSSLCTVETHPDGQRLVIISGGAGYIINPENCKEVTEIGYWFTGLLRVGDMLIMTSPIDLEAIGPEGRRWRTKRISWDGLRNLALADDGRVITGEAWTFADEEWIAFEVDLGTGEVKGGSYSGP